MRKWNLIQVLCLGFFLLGVPRHSDAQSQTITFDESKWNSVVNHKLYRGGSGNTLRDSDFGVDFVIAYGEMYITSSPPLGRMLFFSPIITSTGTTDPSGKVVVRFTNAQERIRLKLSHDEHEVNPPSYMRVSFYREHNTTGLLSTEEVPWNGGAFSNVIHTNESSGIKEVVIETKYAENNLDEVEFEEMGSVPALTGFNFDAAQCRAGPSKGPLMRAATARFPAAFSTAGRMRSATAILQVWTRWAIKRDRCGW